MFMDKNTSLSMIEYVKHLIVDKNNQKACEFMAEIGNFEDKSHIIEQDTIQNLFRN